MEMYLGHSGLRFCQSIVMSLMIHNSAISSCQELSIIQASLGLRTSFSFSQVVAKDIVMHRNRPQIPSNNYRRTTRERFKNYVAFFVLLYNLVHDTNTYQPYEPP